MNTSFRKGFGFGLTSGIITTLGMIVGLHSSTHSALAVVGGVIIIAIADAFSDSLGMHISEEAETRHSPREIWQSSLATFLSKFCFALTFIVPILIFPLSTAIVVSVIWGLLLIGIFSFYIARKEGKKPYRSIMEHLVIALLVVVITHYVGDLVRVIFG